MTGEGGPRAPSAWSQRRGDGEAAGCRRVGTVARTALEESAGVAALCRAVSTWGGRGSPATEEEMALVEEKRPGAACWPMRWSVAKEGGLGAPTVVTGSRRLVVGREE
jgi:hypothetical protein